MKTIRRVLWLFLGAIALSCTGGDGLTYGEVLIIGDGVTETRLDSILTKEGISFTLVPLDSGYYGLPDAAVFSTVILCDGEGYEDGMPAEGQQVLLDYVLGGGNLIIMEWVAYEISEGRYTVLDTIVPMLRNSGTNGTETYTVLANHSITSGVDTSFTVLTGTNIGTARFGTVLVSGTSAGDAVVVHNAGAGRVVQFASSGNWDGFDPFLEANMEKLLLNAIQ